MKIILERLLHGKANQVRRNLNIRQKELFNNELHELTQHVPSEFPRKFEGGIKHAARFKATEYRLLMLYIGIVLFKNQNIHHEVYEHFLLFASLMRILLTEKK